MTARRFTATAVPAPRGGVLVPVPFDPDEVWGRKDRHLVAGTVAGFRVRGEVRAAGDGHALLLGAAWVDGRELAGEDLAVELAPEGPQRSDLADDLAAALAANPRAGAFFDSLAQFYRRAYLRWIDGTKRRPAERARRIAEVVALLADGHKQRPRG
jgi:hypothetical protein